jgi:hypothetical protein
MIILPDSETQIDTILHGTPEGGIIIEQRQEAQDIKDLNRAMYNAMDERTRWADNHNKVASLPLVVFFELKRKGILDDQKAFRKWLNDSDNRYFRTRPGRV